MWLYFSHTPLILLASVSFSRRASAQQLQAHAWPLAVKSPYLSTWYEVGPAPVPLNSTWPGFWNPNTNTGWYCSVQVDGVPYRLMGGDTTPVSNTSMSFSVQITPTRTIMEVQTGPVNTTMTFLSPITATDLTRQSLPFSYFFITASSLDDLPHEVKVYSDITAEWITGNTNIFANATQDIENGSLILQASLQFPQLFTEINDHAQDSTSVYAMKNGSGINYQIGAADVVREAATNSSGLQNSIDKTINAHLINNPLDAWGISADLGSVTTTTSPAVWAIGIMRDPAIQFTMLSSEVQLRSSYYRMNFSTVDDATTFFLKDFENALNTSTQFDLQIANDAANISPQYYDLVSIISRQAMSALEITVSKDVNGNFNSSDVMAFLKNMGNIGDGGVNAVDVLYSAFPMYLYLNPDIGGYLLKPLLISQDSPQYTQSYAAQGLGSNFPTPVVANTSHNFGIEQSGNMIIMILAHLQASADNTIIDQHYLLIKSWADYLVQNSLKPNSQQTSSSDGILSLNQTNLSLKGIIGIGAMAKISHFMGMESDASNYQSVAESYIGQWQNLSLSLNQTRLLTTFQAEGSAGLIYNMYADKLLQTDLIPQSVYEIQTAYYTSQLASSKFGIPLDSSAPDLTRADWILFAGAASGDATLQRSFISLVHSYAFFPSWNTALSPIYDPTTGIGPVGQGINRCAS
ncbi:DUF1793-domain-containing protein [Schizopora paradoxa]|uniref:DUF1793-domain-containing protein n=1 Tax=Schizopora paradoxa TaxID=27342 RepID=A0A0H2S0D9_9AGAM|nr:DUF1793-domain-containing protein [Schizopora paradoxa]